MGGMSGEREVSIETGTAISGALSELGYHVIDIDVGLDLPLVLDSIKPDAAFIALHGRGGEDGTVQGLLEIMRIPYTGCGVLASAVTMDKIVTKQLIDYCGIPVIDGVNAEKGNDVLEIIETVGKELSYPVIVKPACEGSSLGVTRVEQEHGLRDALEAVFEIDTRAIIEKFIDGRLLTVGVLEDNLLVLPVLEVKTSKIFYDYQAKYEPGFTEYEVPADIEEVVAEKAQEISLSSFNILNCEGVARVDLMLENGTEDLFVLEVNTIPGMTASSLLPKAAAAKGISFLELVEIILRGAKTKTHLTG
ncbi:MAG: D-alanine--D-alanine ligase [Actinobacteria bacterium]|nr:D-alanine--D-alanine ligase [Actinomycetota bacterium]